MDNPKMDDVNSRATDSSTLKKSGKQTPPKTYGSQNETPKKRGRPKKVKDGLDSSPVEISETSNVIVESGAGIEPDSDVDTNNNPEKPKPRIDLSTAIDPTQDSINLIDNDITPEVCKTSSPKSPSSLAGAELVTESSQSAKTSSPSPKNKSKKKTSLTDGEAESETESKLAWRIANAICERLCYDDIGGDWYSQKNGLWHIISEKKALKVIMTALDRAMPYGYSMNKLNNAKTFLTLYLLLDKWVSERNLLPMANGVLNTQTMQLMSYSHQLRFNWQLPYSFNPDAKLDVIKQWLWDASGQDLESIHIIRAFFKMALVGGDAQKFLELIGGTGKSTLIRLLVAFVGKENHVATDLKNLETNNFEAAALYGKRLALINDSSRYGGEVSTLKALTGGDPVRYEKKNKQQSGSFVFDGVIVIAANEAIQTNDYTSGLIRRRMPVNFNRKVTDEDKQKWVALGGIETLMHNELPALLNWVLAMTDTEVKKVIGGINGQMTQSQREHLIETNKLAAWIDDNTILKADAVSYVGCSMKKKALDTNEVDRACLEKLYPNYEQWCDENAVHAVAVQRFTSNILDVCQQLKIDVTTKEKDRVGKPIVGLTIRRDHHVKQITPVTKKLLCDDDLVFCDDDVMKQSRASDSRDDGDDIFLSVTNNKGANTLIPDTNTSPAQNVWEI
jgi:putative DNA primase/helicase